jgi:hypothetical protein
MVQAFSWPGSPFGVVRLFLLWSQIEPEPGHYVWDVVGMNGR